MQKECQLPSSWRPVHLFVYFFKQSFALLHFHQMPMTVISECLLDSWEIQNLLNCSVKYNPCFSSQRHWMTVQFSNWSWKITNTIVDLLVWLISRKRWDYQYHMCMCVYMCVCTRACSVMSDSSVIAWTVARQAPLSVGFPRQEYRRGLPSPTSEDLADPGIKPASLLSSALANRLFTNCAT